MPNSRAYGILLSPGRAYPVYNVHKGLITSIAGGEVRTKVFIQNVLLMNWNPPAEIKAKESAYDVDDAIVLGDNMGMVKKLLDDTKLKNSKHLRLDRAYRDIYYHPTNSDGAFALWMMTQRNWREHIVHGIIKNDYIGGGLYRDHDARLPDGRNILAWFDGNISKLVLFRNMEEEKKRTTFCYASHGRKQRYENVWVTQFKQKPILKTKLNQY